MYVRISVKITAGPRILILVIEELKSIAIEARIRIKVDGRFKLNIISRQNLFITYELTFSSKFVLISEYADI